MMIQKITMNLLLHHKKRERRQPTTSSTLIIYVMLSKGQSANVVQNKERTTLLDMLLMSLQLTSKITTSTSQTMTFTTSNRTAKIK
jgi:hypothetical protein